MKENQTYLFREQWESDRRCLIDCIARECRSELPDDGTIFALRRILYDKDRQAKNSKQLKNWEKLNSRPTIDRDQFIVQLAHRVAALESALVEKGGSL